MSCNMTDIMGDYSEIPTDEPFPEFLLNVSSTLLPPAFQKSPSEVYMEQLYGRMGFGFNTVATPLVLAFGVVGNALNLIVLARKRFRKGLDHVERSALTGLIFLAVSDILFCVVGLPGAFLIQNGHAPLALPRTVSGMYYRIYRSGLLNMFIFSSTWMIVFVSVERYLAICHPFKARNIIRINRSITLYLSLLALSVILNIPLFFKHEIISTPCLVEPECVCYVISPTAFYMEHRLLFRAHEVTWCILGTVVPFFLLLLANYKLIVSIGNVPPPVGISEDDRHKEAVFRINVTLVVMVITFLALVGPSMALTFLSTFPLLSKDTTRHYGFQIALLLANFCQALKFASNFVLYCVTNKEFRFEVASVICRATLRRQSQTTSQRYRIVDVANS